MGTHGGPRPNSGRKSKAEEMGLAKLLDQCFTQIDRIDVFVALAAMAKARDLRAIELLLAYTYGKPVQKQEHSGGIDTYIVNIGTSDDSSNPPT